MPAAKQTRKEIKDLLEKIDHTYWGPEERAMIDEALSKSQEIGDDELEYQSRMRLTASAARTGDNDALLSSFAWCLAKHDSNPRKFPSDLGNNMADLMWQFKWIAGTLDSTPIFSLAQCEATLDDMEAHYQREGLGISGVLTARFEYTWSTGQIDKARELRAKLNATPRDDHSHCDACGRSQLAGFAAEFGEEELALKLVDEIVEGHFSCGEEPEHALARVLVALLRAGRLDDALEAHMRSYRLARNNPDNISIVAHNMIFCAITGNEARGLAMVERHAPWLAHDALNEEGQLNMLVAIGVVLDSVIKAGYGDQVVRGADSASLTRFFGEHDGTWTVAELLPVVRDAADTRAHGFDVRNGNDYMSSTVTARRALLNEHYDVPVRTEVFLPPTPAAHEPSTPGEWAALAEVYAYGSLPEQANDAARHAIDAVDPTVRARALQLLISGLLVLDKEDEAQSLMPPRIAALREEGRDAQADMEERVGLGMFGRGSDSDLEALEVELIRLTPTEGEELADVELTLASALRDQESESQDDSDDERSAEVDDRSTQLMELASTHAKTRPSLRFSALWALSSDKASAGELDRALEWINQAIQLDDAISDGARAAALRMKARILGGLERYDEGAAAADEATKIYANHRVGDLVVSNAALAGALLDDAEKYDEEVMRLRYALREAEQFEGSTLGIRFRLGRALNFSGYHQEGAEFLWEVLREEEDNEASPDDRAETAYQLAGAFEGCEKYGNAAGMYERAANWLKEADQPLNAAEMLRRRGNIFRRFEMHDEALESLNEAWELVQGHDQPGKEVLILEALALGKSEAGEASAVDDIDHCISIVANDPDGPFTWKLADLTDSKGRILIELERFQEAVDAFMEASRGFIDAGDSTAVARALHFVGQLSAGPLEKPEEAVSVWQNALGGLEQALTQDEKIDKEDAEGLRSSIRVKLAETLDELGRASEAAQIRSLDS